MVHTHFPQYASSTQHLWKLVLSPLKLVTVHVTHGSVHRRKVKTVSRTLVKDEVCEAPPARTLGINQVHIHHGMRQAVDYLWGSSV